VCACVFVFVVCVCVCLCLRVERDLEPSRILRPRLDLSRRATGGKQFFISVST